MEFLLDAAEFGSATEFLGGREGLEQLNVGGVGFGDFRSCGVGSEVDGTLSRGCASGSIVGSGLLVLVFCVVVVGKSGRSLE